MRFAVIRFGGSNCDLDTVHALEEVIGVPTDLVWYRDGLRREYDAVVLPGGFSYGDYLRAGAIAARTPIMADVLRHAEAGGLVLGICNGAQIGAETGLVPGVFTRNEIPRFVCRPAHLRVETAESPFTLLFKRGEVIRLPVAHGEGRYVAPPDAIARLDREKRIAFRYCDARRPGYARGEPERLGRRDRGSPVREEERARDDAAPRAGERARARLRGRAPGLRVDGRPLLPERERLMLLPYKEMPI